MSDRGKVIPIWSKIGVIPTPKMPASRVDCGLLLSMFTRIAHNPSFGMKKSLAKIKALVSEVIVDCEVSTDISIDAEWVCVDILAKEKTPFGYTIYIPKRWFRGPE